MNRLNWQCCPQIAILIGLSLMLMTDAACGQENDQAFEPLFDGETLNGWVGYRQDGVPESWSVEDGQIRGSGEGPDLITQATYTNFELRFEWKIAEGGNSGVIYRVTPEGEATHHTGPEFQILDDRGLEGEVPPVHSVGAIYGLYGASEDKTILDAGEYNTARIIARGRHLEHWLNDEKVAECQIDSDDWKQKVAASKFQAWPHFARSPGGHIALQSHGSIVWYRNLRLRPLAAEKSDP